MKSEGNAKVVDESSTLEMGGQGWSVTPGGSPGLRALLNFNQRGREVHRK